MKIMQTIPEEFEERDDRSYETLKEGVFELYIADS